MTQSIVAAKHPCIVQVTTGQTYYWCACGLSKNQPFCDGSHKSTSLTPLAWKAEKSGEVAFCACKQTHNAPLCDGSHSKLL